MCKEAVKRCLAEGARSVRRKLGWSQEQMAEYLQITPRAYGDLERERYCFSTWSLLFLLKLVGKDGSWELITLACSHIERAQTESSG